MGTATRRLLKLALAFVLITAVLWGALELFGTDATIERFRGGVERIEDPRDF
jgi:hypothetical protein